MRIFFRPKLNIKKFSFMLLLGTWLKWKKSVSWRKDLIVFFLHLTHTNTLNSSENDFHILINYMMPTSTHTLGTGGKGFADLEDTVKMDTVYDNFYFVSLSNNVQTCIVYD